MNISMFYEAGGCKFLLTFIFVVLILLGGCIGQCVYTIKWWLEIKDDYGIRTLGNFPAYLLYCAIICTWIFGLAGAGLLLLSFLIDWIAKSCCEKSGSTTVLTSNTGVICIIGFITGSCLILAWSAPAKCNEIYSTWNTNYTGNYSYDQNDKFERCDLGHEYSWIFFGVVLFGLVFTLLSMAFCHYCLELNVSILFNDE